MAHPQTAVEVDGRPPDLESRCKGHESVLADCR
jgi:hypothetical protein